MYGDILDRQLQQMTLCMLAWSLKRWHLPALAKVCLAVPCMCQLYLVNHDCKAATNDIKVPVAPACMGMQLAKAMGCACR